MTQVRRFLCLLPALALFALVFGACSDDPAKPRDGAPLSGTVLDAAGDPVPDAGILLTYAQPGKNRPATGFQFQVPDTAQVTACIMSCCWPDTLKVLADQEMLPGSFTLIWDGRDAAGLIVPSGTYDFHLVIDGVASQATMLMLHEDYTADPAEYRFQATTGADGTFTLDQECLAFGYRFPTIDEHGDTISVWTLSRLVRFFALKEGHPTARSDWVTADEQDGVNVTLTFVR